MVDQNFEKSFDLRDPQFTSETDSRRPHHLERK